MSDKESMSPVMRARTETAALIELVRARPCLWDRRHAHYRDRREKDRAWGEVYRALRPAYGGMTRAQQHDLGMIINRKWCNIRDCYKKYLNGTSRVNVSGRPYLYASQLTFLDAIYDAKDLPRGRKRPHDTKDPCHPETEGQEQWLGEAFVDMETPEGEPLEPIKKIKTEYPPVTNKDIEVQENIVSVLVNLIEREEDEDRAFFNSITPIVKSLSTDDKFLFRIRVMKILDLLKRETQLPPLETDRPPQHTDSE